MKRILSHILVIAFLSYSSLSFAKSSSYNYLSHTNSIIFIENQVEFAIFPDGQFDFSFSEYHNSWSLSLSSHHFSFNAGYNYNSYVQYDAFGAIIQIENTPIFYDPFGRVVQIGSVHVGYNSFGQVISVGGLRTTCYNHTFVSFNGYINSYNRVYVLRPWHTYYVVPPVNYCVVYPRPYRAYYRPIRHVYYRPYEGNYRYSNVRVAYTNSRRSVAQYNTSRYRQSVRNGRDQQTYNSYQQRYGRSNSSAIASSRTNTTNNARVATSNRNSVNKKTSSKRVNTNYKIKEQKRNVTSRSHQTNHRTSISKRTTTSKITSNTKDISRKSKSKRTASSNKKVLGVPIKILLVDWLRWPFK